MSLQAHDKIARANHLLLGFEEIYTESELIKKVRWAIENISTNSPELMADFFGIMRAWKAFPVTNYLDNLTDAKTPKNKIQKSLELLQHLFYEIDFEKGFQFLAHHSLDTTKKREFFEACLKFAQTPDIRNFIKIYEQIDNENEEETFAIFLGFLDDQSDNQDVFLILKKIIQEENSMQKIELCLEFYDILYPSEGMEQLSKAYKHFSSLGSHQEFLRFLYQQTNNDLFDAVRKVEANKDKINIVDTFSQGQIRSKKWAIEILRELKLPELKKILILCGWHGLFAKLLDELWPELKIERIRSIDKDPRCEAIAEELNKQRFMDSWNFKAVTHDIMDLRIQQTDEGLETMIPMQNSQGRQWEEGTIYDLWVNTSCEHIEDFKTWYQKIPDGQLLLLQSNDFFNVPEHVNCVNSVEEFRQQVPMSDRLFSGALPLANYTRYMIIGYK